MNFSFLCPLELPTLYPQKRTVILNTRLCSMTLFFNVQFISTVFANSNSMVKVLERLKLWQINYG